MPIRRPHGRALRRGSLRLSVRVCSSPIDKLWRSWRFYFKDTRGLKYPLYSAMPALSLSGMFMMLSRRRDNQAEVLMSGARKADKTHAVP